MKTVCLKMYCDVLVGGLERDRLEAEKLKSDVNQ